MVRFFTLALTLLLASCANHYEPAQTRLTPDQSIYHVNTGDTIQVTVFDEPELTGKYAVDSSGMVALPLVGKTDIGNQTEQQAAQSIAQTLRKAGYLKNPKVSVETTSMRPFYVTGEVEKGGNFPYQSGLTVYQAVAIAGGYTYRADRNDITIRRQTTKGAGAEQRLSAKEDTPVLPGDAIEIGERFF